MDVESHESVSFFTGVEGSSRTPSYTSILEFTCLGWENACKMNVAWLSVLLSLYWKPYIGEELLHACFYMKDPMRSSKENSEIVQLENLVWSLWGHSSSNTWKLLWFLLLAEIGHEIEPLSRCQATLENSLQISLCVSRYVAVDPYSSINVGIQYII